MTETILFIGSNILLGILASIYIGWLLWLGYQTNRAANVILALLIAGIVLLVIAEVRTTNTKATLFQQWFFDMDEDRNVPAIYAAVLWMIMGVLFLMMGIWRKIPILQRMFWYGLAVLMFYLCIDDYYAIHEVIVYSWHSLYRTAAMVLAVVGVGAFFGWLLPDFRSQPAPFVIMGTGVVMLAYSGLFLESWMYGTCDGPLEDVLCGSGRFVASWEEFYELLSIVIVIGGFIHYLRFHITNQQWRKTVLALSLSSFVLIISLLVYMNPMPELERRFLAQPVNIVYGDELRLTGYWVSNPEPKPGERIHILLYWQTPQRVSRNYHLSVHLLSNPDFQSHAQADRIHIGQFPARAWLSNTTVRGAVHLDVPGDIPTPGSYWISVRVWDGSIWDGGSGSRGLTVTDSNVTQMDEQTVFITRLPIISPSDVPATVETTTDYHFSDGFTLTGYTLPERVTVPDGTFAIEFRWNVTQRIKRQYMQFIHLQAEDGSWIVLDRQPFNGNLLTDDWIPSLSAVDTAYLILPTDIASGTYTVYTGMYVRQSGERIAVTGSQGDTLPDATIPLGVIMVE